MISNPVKFNYSTPPFTYTGGKDLYHFCPNDNHLSTTMENNLIFFADNQVHAKNILEAMFRYMIEGLSNRTPGTSIHEREFKDTANRRLNYYKELLEALSKGKIEVQKIPKDQFFKVGWAANDNIY